ncbi:MAG: winged helix-turn-helix domain-containing protein [Thaumarchaeota archaeon]|jgi:predicted ArsR family transcriptional regulator|nr:winged helix-turn-helix domain-containing protein [Candidatus Geocrenenecus arthurdayi]MCL7389231.1 winged helix-turn-helix domain-containing protein [Candidatus Geocrenenecus arthurdayi]MCL7390871.1 winged helix-turn-helix domain-containing protein [Candidatus Geocrenenecus arthurdayi]MCL7396439.1 winged helix-turn-helix domain-containing protein [Candidatus Geocrenenecus arthurdayi]MCL7403360.1 winged helix-turn-helix domain-containing protein [Candidatus Geocrenenecus arthurdayi]
MAEVNPRAYLARIKNVKKGVNTRSKILEVIKSRPLTLKSIAEQVGKSGSSIRRHLKNMEAEGIVKSQRYKGRIIWMTTGVGQKAIEEVY